MANLDRDYEVFATFSVNFTQCLMMWPSDLIQACTVCFFFLVHFPKTAFQNYIFAYRLWDQEM